MFDWNDQQLENVIWDEAGEGDDHIVPFQESANVKPKPVAKSDLRSSRLEKNSQDDKKGRSQMDSWTNLTLSNAAETDQDSMVAEVSEYESSRDELARLDNGSGIIHNHPEDREESDFVDYSWANIGSFDDLHKIFSNDDPMFGHEEPWTSSEDVPISPDKSFNLSMDKPFTAGYENINDFSSHSSHNFHGGIVKDQRETITTPFSSQHDATTFVAPMDFKPKVNRQIKSSKSSKSEYGPPGNHVPKFDGQYGPRMGLHSPCLPIGQQNHLQGPKSSPMYGTMGNYYSSGYEVPCFNINLLNESPDVPVKPLTMTPQQKIDKLRWRQKMRAMLAIKKQQQQLSQKSSQDNQIQLLEGGNIEVDENMSNLPSLDNCSMEETMLYRLQNIISKLDIQVRRCIRDSLSRLAQSAMHRQYASDTSSASKCSGNVEVLTKEEKNSCDRFTRVPDMETDTNPIDRIVVRLLFHSPLESTGPELHYEKKPTNLTSFPMGYWPEYSISDQPLSYNGYKFPFDTSENASYTEAMEV